MNVLIATALLAAAPAIDALQDQLPKTLRVPISIADSQLNETTMMFAPGGPPLPIFLNRWGGEYFGGPDDSSTNSSSIVQGTALLGQFQGSDAQWAEMLTCVQDLFSPFNTYVTEFEPADGDYVEAVVGGSPDQIGMPFGVGGVSPYDPFGCQIISKSIVYAFADVYGDDMRALCETVAQEVAHSFTLDHELLCEDPMTYLDGCGEKSFQDVYAACGESQERACSCNRDSQNSVQLLFELLGPGDGVVVPPPPTDNGPPVLELVTPRADASKEAFTDLDVEVIATDDSGIVSLQLHWLVDGSTMPCPGTGEGWSCVQNGASNRWRISVTEGMREFFVKARDVVGNVAQTETRAMWFGTGPSDVPPNDLTPPEVTIVSPRENGTVTGDEYQIVATAFDADTRVLSTSLLMFRTNRVSELPCPFQAGNFASCTVEGGTYTWTFRNRRESERSVQVISRDLLGNIAESEVRSYKTDPDGIPPPAPDALESNDTWDFATPLACGEAIDASMHNADVDWFQIDAAPEHRVTLEVTGDARALLTLSAHSAPVAAGLMKSSDTGVLAYVTPESGVRVQVRGPVEGDYRIFALCSAPPPVAPPTCSHTGAGDGFGADVFALVALAFLGRRRR